MYALGIDIGTTSICAAVVEYESARVIKSVTAPNDSYIAACDFESVQDPRVILSTVIGVCADLCRAYKPIAAIGLSCQMHGILYIDDAGDAASPLYTWQDGRGDLTAPGGGVSYAGELAALSGRGSSLATGYGAVTHYYNTRNRIVPKNAAGLCTIGDYVGMKLTGSSKCRTHASNAASIALYRFGERKFDGGAISKAGMDPSFFPEVETGCVLLGETRGAVLDENGNNITGGIAAGIPVSCCIGDNQASYLGSVAKPDDSVLINVGTGGQISVSGANLKDTPRLEIRPLSGDRFLQVGATLCAGRAYAALERFFASVLKMAGAAGPDSLYDAMGAALENAGGGDGSGGGRSGESRSGGGGAGGGESNVSSSAESGGGGGSGRDRGGDGGDGGDGLLVVSTLFSGTRDDPDLRGSITNIGLGNFTPRHLISGVLEGIAEEFYGLYEQMDGAGKRGMLVGSGNGLRKNAYLVKTLSRRFGMRIHIPVHTEEAAFGCAQFALTACGHYGGLSEAQSRISYIDAEL